MGNNFKGIDIKRHAYYFFDDIINIKNFDPDKIKVDEKSYKKYFYLLHWTCNDQRFEIHKY